MKSPGEGAGYPLNGEFPWLVILKSSLIYIVQDSFNIYKNPTSNALCILQKGNGLAQIVIISHIGGETSLKNVKVHKHKLAQA